MDCKKKTNNTRTIKELMSEYSKIWFVIDDEYKAQFVDECNSNGYAFLAGTYNAGPLTVSKCGMRMALNAENKTIWYVSGICFHYSFLHPEAVISLNGSDIRLCINYKAFTTGANEYIYESRDRLITPEEIGLNC